MWRVYKSWLNCAKCVDVSLANAIWSSIKLNTAKYASVNFITMCANNDLLAAKSANVGFIAAKCANVDLSSTKRANAHLITAKRGNINWGSTRGH